MNKEKIKNTVILAGKIGQKLKKLFPEKKYNNMLGCVVAGLVDSKEAAEEISKYVDKFESGLGEDYETSADLLVELQIELDHILWHVKEMRKPMEKLTDILYERSETKSECTGRPRKE